MKRANPIKIVLLASAVTLLSTVLNSCQPDEILESNSTIRSTFSSLFFNYNKTTFPVTIITGIPWALTCEADWLSTDTASGDYSSVISITAQQNDSAIVREADIIIHNEFESIVIHVTQGIDQRNFLDIQLEGILYSWTKISSAKLKIPYRKGNGEILKKISVTVAGEAKGSIVVDEMKNIVLSQDDGFIELNLTGRPASAGTVIFTVAGLPSNVFGEGTQCVVMVNEGLPLSNFTIAELKEMRFILGMNIYNKIRLKAVVCATNESGIYAQNEFVVFDDTKPNSGLVIGVPDSCDVKIGDECYIYAIDGRLATNKGATALYLASDADVEIISEGNYFNNITLGTTDLSGYESMPCKILQTQVDDSDVGKQTFAGNTKMGRYKTNGTYNLYLDPSRNMASTSFSTNSGAVSGIVGFNENNELALLPRNANDLAQLKDGRFDMSAIFEVDSARFGNIDADGASRLSFKLTSTLSYSITSSSSWLKNITPSSGNGSTSPQTIYFDVAPNIGGRRSGNITISAVGAPSLTIQVVQLETAPILIADMSGILTARLADGVASVFPYSGSKDYYQIMPSIGLDGWYATHCYLSATDDGLKGLVRVGKSYEKGYIMTPTLAALTSEPTNIELSMIVGMYKSPPVNWIGITLEGPGEIQASSDVMYLENYTDDFPNNRVETLPFYLITGLSDSQLKTVTVKINGATDETRIKLTATFTSSSTALIHTFIFGDVKIYYKDL